jgi:quercetin dioxygenase-like cupin family protein
MSENMDVFFRAAGSSWRSTAPGVRRMILAHNEQIMLVRVAFETTAVGPSHSHPHVQCSMVESGVFDVTIAGRTQRLHPGDGFTVPPNAEHGVVAVEAGELLDSFAPARLDFLERA